MLHMLVCRKHGMQVHGAKFTTAAGNWHILEDFNQKEMSQKLTVKCCTGIRSIVKYTEVYVTENMEMKRSSIDSK